MASAFSFPAIELSEAIIPLQVLPEDWTQRESYWSLKLNKTNIKWWFIINLNIRKNKFWLINSCFSYILSKYHYLCTMKTLLDVHTHTIASGHAFSSLQEMTLTAKEKGLDILGITEHGPNIPGTCILSISETFIVFHASSMESNWCLEQNSTSSIRREISISTRITGVCWISE